MKNDMPDITENTFRSPLREQLLQFLMFKRSVGYQYITEEELLLKMDLFFDSVLPAACPVINEDTVRQYLARRGRESEATRLNRLSLIREFCRFLALIETRTFIPPKGFMDIKAAKFVPRILTRAEAKKFVRACLNFPNSRTSPIRGTVLGVALLLLYLTGLRTGEALNLTINDVDIESGCLHIRNSKFGKSRYVPLAEDLVERLYLCCKVIEQRLGRRGREAPFFCTCTGKPYSSTALRGAFHHVLDMAGIAYLGKGYGPRLHDLRHTAAVHRMLLWYEEGSDLEAKLPLLSVYLGHKDLISTQYYLHLTEELISAVTSRYQERFGHIINDRPLS